VQKEKHGGVGRSARIGWALTMNSCLDHGLGKKDILMLPVKRLNYFLVYFIKFIFYDTLHISS